ncbi:hypothetical protein H4582DRAFT_102592 [Lactarius indigo]|nr:hypothetical protein H4582DRAFT_102592 [Lactarius indigo]
MTDYTLPLGAHGTNRSEFLERAWNIGRAYRNQALELISICRLLSQIAPPKFAHEDAGLRRVLQANARFQEATRLLSSHSHAEREDRLDLPLSVYSRMEIAQQKDSVERDWSYVPVKSEDERGRMITINFMLLRTPLLSPHDPETVVVSQVLRADSSFPEILWNFCRYKGRARIILEQNPHFYLRFPADESAYSPKFWCHPLRDPGGIFGANDTAYDLWQRVDTEWLLDLQRSFWSS